jgi:serine/threonine protein kinase
MTNRAHHPADRDSPEFSSDESQVSAPEEGQVEDSGRVGVDDAPARESASHEAVSRERIVPIEASPDPALKAEDSLLVDPDEDEEEVVPEPESIDGPAVEPAAVFGIEAAAVDGSAAGPAPTVANAGPGVPLAAAPSGGAPPEETEPGGANADAPGNSMVVPAGSGAPEVRRASRPPPLTPEPAPVDVGARRASRPPPLTPQPAPVEATPVDGGARRASRPPPLTPEVPPVEAARRVSRPPPLTPELSAAELAASQSAFTGATPRELSAEELASVASEPADASAWPATEPSRPGAKRASFSAPWVDEVPDPVTPYEQRVSETVKVADLPPVEQSRGRVLANRYLAEEVAEHTACSISYRSYHLALDRAVTVRILLRGLACSDEACQEVRRVAAAASALAHPHIAATLDFGVLSDGWPFVVTESFQGNTLSSLLAADGKFVLRRVMHVGKQIALGLAAAHEQGITHGLLGPDNVLVVEPGTPAEVTKILGFGINKARGAVPGPPRSGVFGVPFYVSPEQAACRTIDARSDIYSLGVILYELMTGAPPFSDGDFAGVLCQHLDDDAPPPSSKLPSPGALAKALDAIIERCLRKEPEKRYQTAAEVADDLVRLEAAAARSKRRPMPEVQKPTTTIHSPHPKLDAPEAPGAKVIVHDDIDDVASPEAPEVAARRSSPSVSRSSPKASPSSKPASSPGGGSGAGRRPSTGAAARPTAKPTRVRVDQATIKISALDRERIMLERLGERPTWFGAMLVWIKGRASSLVTAVRRLFAPAARGDDSR